MKNIATKSGPVIKPFKKIIYASKKYRSLKKEFERTLKVVGSHKTSLDFSYPWIGIKGIGIKPS